jgi:hypothetical protein
VFNFTLFFCFFFGFCFEESLLCDEEKAQRYTVPVHGALNGEKDALMHPLTGHADVTVSRAPPRATMGRRILLLVVILVIRTSPF